ncbi:Vms1/Ankzf1 family peptidyl-tRNA hydrolase [Halopenitus sp. POP-27]|uniref:Vms1/Ankzf1 family peptidyl-tRNA hydrolase n=1 Tax=Halopenitus sp. POP-27 TaxID=2994425 RepID=UPI002468EE9B|nr:Vms1/Ankzf1 family peptidyl-tRNA hydrolase [Halopenitus sp. POP-27]
MLDELLGRAELKSRIEELEETNHHLERQLEAERERRAEATAAKQDAEERINRLEDRIEELEDRVERASGDDSEREFRRVHDARGARTRDLLDRLSAIEAGNEGALTAMVASEDAVPEPVADHFGDATPLVRRAAPAVVVADDSGMISAALRPPIEPAETTASWDATFELPRHRFLPTGRFGFALVRSDLFAVGVYGEGTDPDGDDVERTDYEGFESDVKSAHSKGGFSQGRFERRRDDQIDEHLDAARDALEPLAADADLDRLIVVGERSVLGDLRDLADVTDVSDATGDPEPALAAAFADFWTTRVYAI